MHTEFLMGNAAIAMGAIAAGLNVVSGYPGTPSTEVLETTAKHNDGSIYVEWSTNEKAAMELAAGAAYCGARTMVTMKQVGLNVASDPLMSLAYIGVKGGMVILVADDPGPISSQTEQDTRRFAAFSKLPCFDPSGVQEAYDMIQEAFAYSERYHTPVLFRPTTRVCHGYASITVKDVAEYQVNSPAGFVKDSSKWVIFPKLSYQNHIRMEKRNTELQSVFSGYPRNRIYPETDTACQKGIATHGISFSYTMEALHGKAAPRLLKVATPFPFPEQLAVEFLQGLDEVLCLEELDPVIEQELVYLCGKYHLPTRIRGKLTEDVALAGENSCDSVAADLAAFLGWRAAEAEHSRPAAGTAGTSAGALCRLSAQSLVLCRKRSNERQKERILRRYWLLYAGQRHAAGHGGYLSVHGCRCQHDAGHWKNRTGYHLFCFRGGFHIFCVGNYRHGQRGIQSGKYDAGGAGQFHHSNDRTSASPRHRKNHDGAGGGQGEHRGYAPRHRCENRRNCKPAALAGGN